MSDTLIHSKDPVTLVGGGEATVDDVRAAVALAPVLAAADSGAELAIRAGISPQAVIGDFDSLRKDVRNVIDDHRLHHISEQDTTDFDKALGGISAPVVLAVGFLGGRLDHQMAAFSTLLRYPDTPCVLIGRTEIAFLLPPRIEVAVESDNVVSLYPMQKVTGQSKGLAWPIDGLILSPQGRIGTSNRSIGPVSLSVTGPGLMGIFPRHTLLSVTQALCDLLPEQRWPQPARA
jgi:thiamine pyrophosphokinase